ncbi:hypothetical protein CBQ26_00930 [Deinococcus indicus]|uniref:Uncharacterized protein n=1 Tax=Deinococcus indicus TaxID=223556 RepID=A0A246BTR2_9DEIO|nr:hypothetical protein [Deinococcus indicus]OWL98925.1 hypothetical protein CBQ26_00265 [Deinococcus indicus]OWL99057.1 hypothetical protein CBQ26_00930 [Deinococcus indicus]
MNALGSRYLIAQAVQASLRGKDQRLKSYTVGEHDLTLHLDRVELTARSEHAARRIENVIRTMPDAQLGRYVRDAEHLLNRLLAQQTGTASAPLIRLALSCVQSGVAGLMRGGSKVAVSDINAQITQFDEQLFTTLNSELEYVRETARLRVEQKDADIQRLIAQADQEMKADYARCVADLETRKAELDAREATLREQVEADLQMALRAADQAQADASEARRQLDAASAQITRERAAHEQALAELKRTLAAERTATINRDRDTRNQIHQLEQDKRTLSSTVGHLNQECERLEAELATARTAAPEPAPVPVPAALEVTAMPTPTLNPRLAAMSCAVYLTAHGIPTRADGDHLTGEQTVQRSELIVAWSTEYPTDEARRAHLRASIRPLLAQDAA